MGILNLFKKVSEPSHFKGMISDGAKMTLCGWCGNETPVWQPMDCFGFGGTSCHWCKRNVDEFYLDWMLREEWECGCVHVASASGHGYESGHSSLKPALCVKKTEEPKTVFSRSVDEAISKSPRVIMYPDGGGYTGISISPYEGRMYAFGRLLKQKQPVQNVDILFENWKPWMDELLENYRVWYSDIRRTGCSITDVVTFEMQGRIKSLMGDGEWKL